MHIVKVSPSMAGAGSYCGLFAQGLKDAGQRTSRIYRTYISVENGDYVFETTSKEIHLHLGSLEDLYHIYFTLLLEEEFSTNHCSQLLLRLENEGGDKTKEILITRITEGTQIIFTLSPAH